MTPDEKRQRCVGLLREAHAHAMGAQNLCDDLELGLIITTLICRMAALETKMTKQMTRVPVVQVFDVTGPRTPKRIPGGEPGSTGAAVAGSVPPEPAPPATTRGTAARSDQ